MRFLPDVNVLFPLLVSRHVHRSAALEWFDGVDVAQVAVCRLTKLGVLRLLCTPQIMGADALTPTAAIEAFGALEADERISVAAEPEGVDAVLKRLVTRCATTPNLWSDAYLAAFAKQAGLRLVLFDRGFAKFPGLDFIRLGGR